MLPAALQIELGAERAQGQEMRVVPPPADHVTAGTAEAHLLVAAEQRAGEQERRADLLRECCGHFRALERPGHPNAVAIELLDLGAERGRDLEHPADVP